MDMSITDAAAMLADLVRRAEAGEEVVLTRDGMPAVRLVAAAPKTERQRKSPEEIIAAIKEIQDAVAAKGLAWPNMTSNHDDLYDEFGLPT